ncbi:NADH dehydrogenase subunit L [Acidilobus saccharovorans 345-15]|uniref:NADH dehydrogenase subunit L n=1 Tax=Acidilobus saccharovorans (strain DSM 16705 / JCM 18335 / VKM B-2471 / 345-15) TaxID=666510 RepID=D9Q0E3_ACIS3|nr:NADH-quinone oxidoreductase subunit L [Acidilobus saccharovorans]ADL18781.1 NADH dehydrogenase subunit L [Acidilobus saccharovorans 345-15]
MTVVHAYWLTWSWTWLAPFTGAGLLALLWLAGVRREQVYSIISVLSVLASALVSTAALYYVLADHEVIYATSAWYWDSLLRVHVGVYLDGLSAIMATVVSWLSFLIDLYSVEYMKGDWGVQRYFFFISFFVGSMMLVVTASNLILMFVGWEGTGLASYALIGHWYTDEEEYWVGVPRSTALGKPMYFEPSTSGVRAILFTRVGDVGFIIGMTGLFALVGSMSIPAIASSAGSWMAFLASRGLLAIFLFVFTLGALSKSAQFPFFEWLVTAMTGPTPVSALIHAATMVKVGVYYMLRFAPIFFVGALVAASLGAPAAVAQVHEYFLLVASLAAVTLFMMATMAIVNHEFKLILAFSTAEYLGYMILAVAAGGLAVVTGNYAAMAYAEMAGLAMLIAHAVFKAALFLVAGYALHASESRFIDDMGNFWRYMKATGISTWLAGLSLAAVPPFLGFFAKELVLGAVERTAVYSLYALAVIAVVFTAAYITRLIVRVFHLPPLNKEAEGKHYHEAPALMLIPYAILGLASIVLGAAWFYVGYWVASGVGETLDIRVTPPFMPSIDLTTIVITAVVIIDILGVALLYMRRHSLVYLLQKSDALKAIHSFLFNRWYVNSAIYYLFLDSFAGLSWLLNVVNRGIDLFYHYVLPKAGELASRGLRGLLRGRTDYILTLYLFMMVIIGILMFMAWR